MTISEVLLISGLGSLTLAAFIVAGVCVNFYIRERLLDYVFLFFVSTGLGLTLLAVGVDIIINRGL